MVNIYFLLFLKNTGYGGKLAIKKTRSVLFNSCDHQLEVALVYILDAKGYKGKEGYLGEPGSIHVISGTKTV